MSDELTAKIIGAAIKATEDTEKNMEKLEKEYRLIKKKHREAILSRLARSAIGSSIVRVFKKGSKESIRRGLEKIKVDEIIKIRNEKKYRKWFEKQLNVLARIIKKTNKGNKKIEPGHKWGHATKILCLYLRDVIIHKEYFSCNDTKKINKLLYCPIDSQIMKALEKKCGISLQFHKIKDINASGKFYDIQNILGRAAKKIGVPRVWFDDNWANRQ